MIRVEKNGNHPCQCRMQRCLPLTMALWTVLIVLLTGWEFRQYTRYSPVDADFFPVIWGLGISLVWLGGMVWLFFLSLNIRRMKKNCNELFLLERDSARKQVLFDSVINSLTEVIIMLNTGGKIILTNPVFTELTGYAFEEVQGRGPDFLFADPVASPPEQADGSQQICEIDLRKKNGDFLPVEILKVSVRDREGKHIGCLLVARDISARIAARKEKENLESRLRQSARMEAIGTLAGGIAHDFNNILGIININTEIALEDLPEDDQVRTNLLRIEKACRRAGNLVKQILAYSRQTDCELIPLMPGPIIKESLKFLRSTTPATMGIEYNINDEFNTVMVNPVELQQLLVHLFSNFRHAMGDRGTVKITGTIVELAPGDSILDEGMSPGRFFRFSVCDTGTGMDTASRERINTAKGMHEGNGIGLSMVKGFASRHGAAVAIASEPGKGAMFQIFFPVVYTSGETADFTEEDIQPGNERILIVDDEHMLVEMVSFFLERYGYSVTAEIDSRKALEIFTAAPDEFDIVITDQTMPEMTGSEMAAEMLKIRPDIPIILLSGYSKKISEQEIKEIGIREFVYKPFDGRTLAGLIRKTFD